MDLDEYMAKKYSSFGEDDVTLASWNDEEGGDLLLQLT